jgi:hypothetical protein
MNNYTIIFKTISIIAFTLVCFFLTEKTSAQTVDSTFKSEQDKPRSLGIEFLGSGGVYSINYERVIFSHGIHACSVRMGGEFVPLSLLVLTGINYLITLKKFQILVGFIPAFSFAFDQGKDFFYFFSSTCIGPRFVIRDFLTIGLAYNYFFIPLCPDCNKNGFGLSLSIPIF